MDQSLAPSLGRRDDLQRPLTKNITPQRICFLDLGTAIIDGSAIANSVDHIMQSASRGDLPIMVEKLP
jgi:hypothetical protein